MFHILNGLVYFGSDQCSNQFDNIIDRNHIKKIDYDRIIFQNKKYCIRQISLEYSQVSLTPTIFPIYNLYYYNEYVPNSLIYRIFSNNIFDKPRNQYVKIFDEKYSLNLDYYLTSHFAENASCFVISKQQHELLSIFYKGNKIVKCYIHNMDIDSSLYFELNTFIQNNKIDFYSDSIEQILNSIMTMKLKFLDR